MFNSKTTLFAAAVATAVSGALLLTGCSDNGSADWKKAIEAKDGKYLDGAVVKAILGNDDRERLVRKLDPNNPYSFEVDDAIDGGAHGNMQCKVPAAFLDVHANVKQNYYDDAGFSSFGYGTPVAETALKNWKIHVDGDGQGLPSLDVGMTVEKGANMYIQFCSVCHGEFGEGAKGYLPLAEGDPLPLATSEMNAPAPVKTVGNYWPYATTLYDYNRRAMPFWTPNMAAIGEAGYMGITGYILQMNAVELDDAGTLIEDDDFFNAEMLMKANKYMRNAGSFFCDHRPVIANERCMKDCPDYMVGDGTGNVKDYRTAGRLPDGTPQYNVEQRIDVSPPGVGHSGF